MSDIKPALTAAEWMTDSEVRRIQKATWGRIWAPWSIWPDRPHAIAASALHDQPFGFSWEMVDQLRAFAKMSVTDESADDGEVVDTWQSTDLVAAIENASRVAARIAALLPPRQ